MALHIIKLCVGAQSIQDLLDWHDHQAFTRLSLGLDPRPVCDTRMSPKRRDEVLNGGSLFWVIKGQILVRQEIEDIVTLDDVDGRSRCEIVLKHFHVQTATAPCCLSGLALFVAERCASRLDPNIGRGRLTRAPTQGIARPRRLVGSVEPAIINQPRLTQPSGHQDSGRVSRLPRL
jgi:hypothetical protein